MQFNNIPLELQLSSGIYQIVNLVNNKRYIGSAKCFKTRWKDHYKLLKSNKHYNRYLQAAWNKYSEWNFKFEVIEYTDWLIQREQHWIDFYKAYGEGYNLRPKANSNIGIKFSQEIIDKMIAAKLAGKGFKHSEETKAKMRMKKPYMSIRMKGNQYNKGKKYSEEEKIRLRNQPRKFDKWPHKLGFKCKCGECKEKRTIYSREWRKRKRNAANV